MRDHHESTPVHPGRILLERVMQPLGISRNQLARDIDVPVGRISDITNGKRGITADTAMRLGRYFGVPPQLWLRLQAEYDLHLVRTTTWHEIESRVRILDPAKALSALQLTPEPPSAPPAATRLAEPPPAETSSAPANPPVTPPDPRPAELEPVPPAPEARKQVDQHHDMADSIGIPPVPADDRT